MEEEEYISSKWNSKTCVKWPFEIRQNKDLNNNWQLNEGQKYCKKVAILLTCIKRIFGLENQFLVSFLRVAVLHRFYCIYIQVATNLAF